MTNNPSRRSFLAALAAAGPLAAVASGGDSLVHASAGLPGDGKGGGTGSGDQASNSPTRRTQAFPASTPGTNYTVVFGGDFEPYAPPSEYSKNETGIIHVSGFGGYQTQIRDIPRGARITEVAFMFVKGAANRNQDLILFRFGADDLLIELASTNTTSSPVSASEQVVSLAVTNTSDWLIDEASASHWLVNLPDPEAELRSVRIGWTSSSVGPLIPIAPKRVYDSRFTAPTGPLATGANRPVSVANGFPDGSGISDVANLVPAGAVAVNYNLTVVNTVNRGFLSVNPGGAATSSGSSINWATSGLVLANGLTGKLNSNRQFQVFCGGTGSTDFIIDVLGYYMPA